MTAERSGWRYANLPEDELAPSPRQIALRKLAQAAQERDAHAAKAALHEIPHAASAALDPLDKAAADIIAAAHNDEDPPRQALDDIQSWLAAAQPLQGGKLTRERYEREWLVPGWIPAARTGLLTGAGGIGKTRLALQLANAVAKGHDWLSINRRSQNAAPAVYATYEDEMQELGHRLSLIDANDGGAPLTAYDLSDAGALWHFPYGSSEGALAPAGEKIRQACERADARLLVVDNLASAFGGNENDRAQVRSFMNAWDSWSRKTGCATLMIGHPPKGRGFAKDQNGLSHIAEMFSGSTDWLNAARYAIALDNKSEADSAQPQTHLRMLKANYSRNFPDIIPLLNNQGVWTAESNPLNADPPGDDSIVISQIHDERSEISSMSQPAIKINPIPKGAI